MHVQIGVSVRATGARRPADEIALVERLAIYCADVGSIKQGNFWLGTRGSAAPSP